ncbi:type II secretion system protein [Escherichia coli]|nr:type II secretion system protein [Escherichia coli]
MIKKKGFTLLEVTIVLGIGTLIAFMKFQDMRNDQEAVLADNVGTQIKQLGEAVTAISVFAMTGFPHCHHPTTKVAIRGQEPVRLLVVKSLTRR